MVEGPETAPAAAAGVGALDRVLRCGGSYWRGVSPDENSTASTGLFRR